MHKRHGFTVVEMVIVIAVIAILATITVVAYSNVQEQSRASALSSYLNSVAKDLAVYKGRNGTYPSSITTCPATTGTTCLEPPEGATINYSRYTDDKGKPHYSILTQLGNVTLSGDDTGALPGGANMYAGSAGEKTSSNEFLRYADLAPLIDQIGLVKLKISFDIKSANIASRNTMNVYMQNGSTAKYSIGVIPVPVTTSYVRQSITVTPSVQNSSVSESWLAFYGTYGTGNIPSVRNLSVERVP